MKSLLCSIFKFSSIALLSVFFTTFLQQTSYAIDDSWFTADFTIEKPATFTPYTYKTTDITISDDFETTKKVTVPIERVVKGASFDVAYPFDAKLSFIRLIPIQTTLI